MTILFLFRGALRGLIDLGDWSVEVSIAKFYNRIGLKGGSRSAEKVADEVWRVGEQDNDISWFLTLGTGASDCRENKSDVSNSVASFLGREY